jgi:hypothetical protein
MKAAWLKTNRGYILVAAVWVGVILLAIWIVKHPVAPENIDPPYKESPW